MRELLERLKKAQREEETQAFLEACYEALFETLYLKAIYYTLQDADAMDLVQSFFADHLLREPERYIHKIPACSGPAMMNYILVMFRNFYYRRYQKRRKYLNLHAHLDYKAWGLISGQAEGGYEEEGPLNEVLAVIAQLKPAQQRVVEMRLEGKKYEEIAQATGDTETAVKTRYHRAKNTLRRILQEKRSGEGLALVS